MSAPSMNYWEYSAANNKNHAQQKAAHAEVTRTLTTFMNLQSQIRHSLNMLRALKSDVSTEQATQVLETVRYELTNALHQDITSIRIALARRRVACEAGINMNNQFNQDPD
jgi:hypothetical protein